MARLGAVLALAILVVGGAAGAAVPIAPRNKIAATDDAAVLLGRLLLPADAQPSQAEPSGDGGTLAHPFMGPPATPNGIDDHGWWVLSESPAAVLAYVLGHRPHGGHPGMSGTSGGGGNPTAQGIGFTWPAIAGTLSTRWLLVEVVALAGGGTGLRADSQVVWITPRPASERIPDTARRLVVSTRRFGRIILGPLQTTSRAAVRRVVALLNALPAAQPGTTACPFDWGSRMRLALYGGAVEGAHSDPLAIAVVDPSGCGGVALSIHGRRGPPLAGGVMLARRLSRALGVKIDTGAPGSP